MYNAWFKMELHYYAKIKQINNQNINNLESLLKCQAQKKHKQKNKNKKIYRLGNENIIIKSSLNIWLVIARYIMATNLA